MKKQHKNIQKSKIRRAGTLLPLILLCAVAAGCGSTNTVQQAEVYVNEDTTPASEAAPVTNAATLTSASFADLFAADPGSNGDSAQPGDASVTEILPPSDTDNTKAASAATAKSADTAATESTAESQDSTDYIEIVFLGDTQYTNAQGTGTEIPALVAAGVDPGLCKIYNLAMNGSCATLARSEKDMSTDAWTSNCLVGMARVLRGDVSPDFLKDKYPAIAETCKKIDPAKIDFVVLDYGMADYLNARPLTDEDDPDQITHFGGAYNKAILLLQKACPNAEIVCCSPCYSVFYSQDGACLGDGNSLDNGYGVLANYVGMVEAVSENNDRTVYMDMYHGTKIDLDFYSESDYLSDGIHLTARGRRAYAAAVAQMINKRRGALDQEFELVRIDDQ